MSLSLMLSSTLRKLPIYFVTLIWIIFIIKNWKNTLEIYCWIWIWCYNLSHYPTYFLYKKIWQIKFLQPEISISTLSYFESDTLIFMYINISESVFASNCFPLLYLPSFWYSHIQNNCNVFHCKNMKFSQLNFN